MNLQTFNETDILTIYLSNFLQITFFLLTITIKSRQLGLEHENTSIQIRQVQDLLNDD